MDKTWKVVFAFVGIFIAGTITGGLFTFRIAKNVAERQYPSLPAPLPQVQQPAPVQPPVAVVETPSPTQPPVVETPPPAQPAPPTQTPRPVAAQANPQPPQFGPPLARRLTEQLNLTREQRVKIRPITLRTEKELQQLRRDTQHSTELAIEKMQDDISAILTPDQRVKFEEMALQARDRVKKYLRDQEFLAQKKRAEAQQIMASPATGGEKKED